MLQPGLELGDLLVGGDAFDIGLNHHQPLAVAPHDGGDLLGRSDLDEVADGHRALRRGDLQLVESGDVALVGREANADVQFVLGVHGAKLAHQNAVGDELDGLAHRQHIDAVSSGGHPIDGEVPFDSWRGAAVLQFDDLRVGGEFGADEVGGPIQRRGVGAAQFDLDILAHRRTVLGQAKLGQHAGGFADSLADGRDNIPPSEMQRFFGLEVGEFQLDAADGVIGRAVLSAAAGSGARAGVERLDPRDAGQAALDLRDQGVLRLHRQIAPRHDIHRGVVRILVKEEQHLVGLHGEQRDHGGDDSQGRATNQPRAAAGAVQGPRVPAHEAGHGARIAVLGLLDFGQMLEIDALLAAGQGTERRGDDQGDENRRAQDEEQGQRQIAHELAGDRVPEEERHEGRKGGQGAIDHRPEHALAGGGEGGGLVQALGHFAVGVLHHHDAAVDQDAHRQDQAEHDHLVEGDAEPLQHQEGQQEADRDGGAHHQALTNAERADDDQHHQQGGRDQPGLQNGQSLADEFAVIEGVVGANRGRPVLLIRGDQSLHRLDCVQDVGSRPLDNLHREGRLTVETADVGGILERAVDLADVADGDHPIAIGLDRQAQDVVGVLHHAGQFHREGPLAGDQVAGRHQLIVASDHPGQILGADAIGFHAQGIDGDLQKLISAAGDIGAQHAGQALQVLFEGAGGGVEGALGGRSRQDDADRGIVGDVGFVDDRRQGVWGEAAARQIDLGADVLEHLVLVEVDLEFQGDHGDAAIGPRIHLLEALDRLQFALQGPHEQALGVFGADPGVGDLHDDEGDGDVRLSFAR